MIIVSKLGICLKLLKENLTWLLLNLLEENVFYSNSTLHADFEIHRHWNSPFRFPSLVVLFFRFVQIYQNCIIEISYCLPSNQPQTGVVLLLCCNLCVLKNLLQWFCEKKSPHLYSQLVKYLSEKVLLDATNTYDVHKSSGKTHRLILAWKFYERTLFLEIFKMRSMWTFHKNVVYFLAHFSGWLVIF